MAFMEQAGGLAAATPWGAAIGAIGNVASAAVADVPTNVTSGAGPFQGGGITVGAKNIGSGKQDANTSASQAQTPVSESPGATVSAGGGVNPVVLYIAAGIAGLVLILALFRRD